MLHDISTAFCRSEGYIVLSYIPKKQYPIFGDASNVGRYKSYLNTPIYHTNSFLRATITKQTAAWGFKTNFYKIDHVSLQSPLF